MALTWNEQAGRFVGPGGRFVSDAAVRAVIDDVADLASARLRAAAERLLAGELSLGAFQAEAMAIIRTSHVAASVIAHGGEGAMTAQRWGATGPVIREQYAFLRGFAADIASGRQPLNGTVASRAEMYGQHARMAYEAIIGAAAEARGLDECRNILHANESCSDCRSLSARGWMPAAEMTPVGSRRCMSRCRCSISRRSSAARAA